MASDMALQALMSKLSKSDYITDLPFALSNDGVKQEGKLRPGYRD